MDMIQIFRHNHKNHRSFEMWCVVHSRYKSLHSHSKRGQEHTLTSGNSTGGCCGGGGIGKIPHDSSSSNRAVILFVSSLAFASVLETLTVTVYGIEPAVFQRMISFITMGSIGMPLKLKGFKVYLNQKSQLRTRFVFCYFYRSTH